MSSRVLLRHPPVAKAWAGRCYGASDMGWSRAGAAAARMLAEGLARERFEIVVHSGLTRTRKLAERVAVTSGAELIEDRRWAERDFGSWEGRRWGVIWRETGSAMDGMITNPECFRPGGGETTAELVVRARTAWEALPLTDYVLVVTHGGPIAAVRKWVEGRSYAQLPGLIPAPGERWSYELAARDC